MNIFKGLMNRAINRIDKTYHKAIKHLLPPENSFLRNVNGVIHIGANTGQERTEYADYGLSVLWVEPINDIFQKLQHNILKFQKQKALQYLITDKDNVECTFFISNNDCASSSILEMKEHKQIWPEVSFVGTVRMKSITLCSLLAKEKIDIKEFDALIIDTQGTELLVLMGAKDILRNFKYIKTEAPNFEAYESCSKVDDISNFLKPLGFKQIIKRRFANSPSTGSYYNIVFKNQNPS